MRKIQEVRFSGGRISIAIVLILIFYERIEIAFDPDSFFRIDERFIHLLDHV